jgi:hypothetical protein
LLLRPASQSRLGKTVVGGLQILRRVGKKVKEGRKKGRKKAPKSTHHAGHGPPTRSGRTIVAPEPGFVVGEYYEWYTNCVFASALVIRGRSAALRSALFGWVLTPSAEDDFE